MNMSKPEYDKNIFQLLKEENTIKVYMTTWHVLKNMEYLKTDLQNQHKELLINPT